MRERKKEGKTSHMQISFLFNQPTGSLQIRCSTLLTLSGLDLNSTSKGLLDSTLDSVWSTAYMNVHASETILLVGTWSYNYFVQFILIKSSFIHGSNSPPPLIHYAIEFDLKWVYYPCVFPYYNLHACTQTLVIILGWETRVQKTDARHHNHSYYGRIII